MNPTGTPWEVFADGPFRAVGSPFAVATTPKMVVATGTVGHLSWGNVKRFDRDGLELQGHRIIVVDRDSLRTRATYRIPYPADTILISEDETFALVSAGDYDGGWIYSGTVYLLDLHTLELHPLGIPKRKYRDISWSGAATVSALASPFTDDDAATTGWRHVTITVQSMGEGGAQPSASVTDLGPAFPADPLRPPDGTDAARTLDELSCGAWAPRGAVTDLHIQFDGTITATGVGLLAERWASDGGLIWRYPAASGGGQIAVTDVRTLAWTYGVRHKMPTGHWGTTPSILWAVPHGPDAPRPVEILSGSATDHFTSDAEGNFLIRRGRTSADAPQPASVIGMADGTQLELALPVDEPVVDRFFSTNTPDLVVVARRRGTEAAPSRPKTSSSPYFARIRTHTGLEPMFDASLVAGEEPRERVGFGCVVRGVRQMLVYSTSGPHLDNNHVVSRDYGTGDHLWTSSIDAESCGIALWSGDLVVATIAGTLTGLNPTTGEITWHRRVEVDGSQCGPVSIHANGAWLAVGLADGRILRTSLDADQHGATA